MTKVIVIGGLSAGPSAAAKARRTDENAEILLFEKTADISYATCGIPYAISGKIQDRGELLVVKPELLRDRFNIDVHLNEPVTHIDSKNQTVTTPEGTYAYDKLVFATGGAAFMPPISGIEEFGHWSHAKSLSDFDRIQQSQTFQNAKHVTVVGAGLIGLETAENLIHMGKQVAVVELGSQILGPWDEKFATFGKKVLIDNGVDVRLQTSIQEITTTGEITLSNSEKLNTQYVIVAIGVVPNTQLLSAEGAETLKNGALVVNNKMETNLPNIYAAGDCAAMPHAMTAESAWFPMGTHSNKAGRTAGFNAVSSHAKEFKGGYGTAIMQLFNYTIARTGMGPKELTAKGFDFDKTLIITGATPGFYPDQSDVFVEIYYDINSKVVLGAELIGKKGIDKRTDVLSTAIYAKLTINDLHNLDLAYAPPFSTAKDAVVVAGFAASNYDETTVKNIGVNELGLHPDAIVVDVRNPNEVANTQLVVPNALNIPLDSLRQEVNNLDTSKKYILYCAKGLRGYVASTILMHHGFSQVYNMDGGFTAWRNMVP